MPAFVLLLLLAPLGALAQSAGSTGRIVGTVIDGDGGESLPGATVHLVGTTLGAATGIDGRFVIRSVPVGVYTVRVSFVGYDPVEVTQVHIEAGCVVRLDVALTAAELIGWGPLIYEPPLFPRDPYASRTISADLWDLGRWTPTVGWASMH